MSYIVLYYPYVSGAYLRESKEVFDFVSKLISQAKHKGKTHNREFIVGCYTVCMFVTVCEFGALIIWSVWVDMVGSGVMVAARGRCCTGSDLDDLGIPGIDNWHCGPCVYPQ